MIPLKFTLTDSHDSTKVSKSLSPRVPWKPRPTVIATVFPQPKQKGQQCQTDFIGERNDIWDDDVRQSEEGKERKKRRKPEVEPL